MEKVNKGSKKIQVTLDFGIYEIITELKDKVYKTDSDSKVCASIIEAFLNEHGYTKAKMEKTHHNS
jgi:CRISPR/Cas system-associated protein Csm6